MSTTTAPTYDAGYEEPRNRNLDSAIPDGLVEDRNPGYEGGLINPEGNPDYVGTESTAPEQKKFDYHFDHTDQVRVVSGIAGKLKAQYGYVVGSTVHPNTLEDHVGENGEPYLSVYVLVGRDARLLAANPGGMFTHYTGVAHESSPAAKEGRAGMWWTDILPKADDEDTYGSLEQHDEFANQLHEAETQRKLQQNVGAGPVRDPNVEIQGATATDVAYAAENGVKVTAKNSTGAMGTNKVALDETGMTKKRRGFKGETSTVPASVDDNDANIAGAAGTEKVLSTPAAIDTEEGNGSKLPNEPDEQKNAVAAEPLSPASLPNV